MSQYTVPKFIDHKAKIVGPLTFRQFIYIGTAGALAFVFYYTLPFVLFFMLSAIIFAGAAALAFGQINGRPIPRMLKSFFSFSLGPKLYLWKRKTMTIMKATKEEPTIKKFEASATTTLQKKEKSRLKSLSVEIETRGK